MGEQPEFTGLLGRLAVWVSVFGSPTLVVFTTDV